MSSRASKIEEKKDAIYQKNIDLLVNGSNLAEAAILATQDGLLIASAIRNDNADADSIAAISASMLALADTIAGQAGQPFVDNLISQTEFSTIVMVHAGELILTIVGQPNVNIGMILSTARKTAISIEAKAKDEKIEFKGHDILSNPEELMERVKKELMDMRSNNGR